MMPQYALRDKLAISITEIRKYAVEPSSVLDESICWAVCWKLFLSIANFI